LEDYKDGRKANPILYDMLHARNIESSLSNLLLFLCQISHLSIRKIFKSFNQISFLVFFFFLTNLYT